MNGKRSNVLTAQGNRNVAEENIQEHANDMIEPVFGTKTDGDI